MAIKYVIAAEKAQAKRLIQNEGLHPFHTKIITRREQLEGLEIKEGEYAVVGAAPYPLLEVLKTRIRN